MSPRSLVTPPHHTSQQTRDEEEDTIHDSKRKARFEHRTRLIDLHRHTIHIRIAKGAEIDIIPCARVDRSAVGVCYKAQFVDAGDEGSHETEIDESDEEGVVSRSVVGEECCDGPGASEHGDDEED